MVGRSTGGLRPFRCTTKTFRDGVKKTVDEVQLGVGPLEPCWADVFVEVEDTTRTQRAVHGCEQHLQPLDMMHRAVGEHGIVVTGWEVLRLQVGDVVADPAVAGFVREPAGLRDGAGGEVERVHLADHAAAGEITLQAAEPAAERD
jgi:hypothetical protein